jgi:hypothetical protein
MVALAPEITVEKNGDVVHSHPAYGNIAVFNVSGRKALYGADYLADGYLTIRVSTSKAKRSLSRFWRQEEQQIVEVAMSHAQWAAFVSSMNVGLGVDCTITRLGLDIVPDITVEPEEKDMHAADLDGVLAAGLAKLEEIRTDIDGLKIPAKTKDELGRKIDAAVRSMGSSQDFVRTSFGKFVSAKTEKMKADVHAYAQSVLIGLGLRSAADRIASSDEPSARIEDLSRPD